MTSSCIYPIRDMVKKVDGCAASDIYPLDESSGLFSMIEQEETKRMLGQLAKPLPGGGRGVLLKEGVACCGLTDEGKFCLIVGNKQFALTPQDAADLFGALPIGQALADQAVNRIRQHNQLSQIWEEARCQVGKELQ